MSEPIPELPAPIDSCLSAIAASPPWQALVRCWSQSNPSLTATSVYLDVLNSPLYSELASRINPSLDSALVESTLSNHHHFSGSSPPDTRDSIHRHNAIVNDSIRSLLIPLPHGLRSRVALRHLSSTSSLAPTAQAYQLRQVVWPTLAHSASTARSRFLPHHHTHDSDMFDVPAMVAMDLHTWLRRSNGQFSQVFLALSQVYSGKLHPNALAPCSRLYALVLHLSSSPSSSPAADGPSQGLWSNPWATAGPDFLLARICTVVGSVLLQPVVDKQDDHHGAQDSGNADNVDEWEHMMPVAAVVMMVVNHLKYVSSSTRRMHLLHIAVGSNGAVFTGPSLDRMEQCLRIFFIGIVPWPTLILLIDYLLCCSSTSAEVVEELVSVMAQATNGDASQLGSLTPSPLLQSLPSITALHLSSSLLASAPPVVPDWLQPALATSSVTATERKMLEDLADGVAFTQRRARALVQRWQRTARAVARWCLFLDALRERVRNAKSQQRHAQTVAAAAAAASVAASKQSTVPRVADPSPTAAPVAVNKPDLAKAAAQTTAATAANQLHIQVLQSTLPSPELIKARPLVALIELVVGQTLGGPSESLVMEMALEAARKRM